MAAKLELSLLGTVAITLQGERVSGQIPAKSQALPCYLAVTGCTYSRDRLTGLCGSIPARHSPGHRSLLAWSGATTKPCSEPGSCPP
ncbi:MAG TPA: hypothetical protein VLY63_29250 [Anaerolineae bacterium]|nr:hypothetical protein [Anaerolineae bacterium]